MPRLTRRYRPLARHLAALPVTQPSLRLTLVELEALLGPRLNTIPGAIPLWTAAAVATTARQCWDYQATYDRSARAITFTRQPSTPLATQEV